MIPYPDFFQNFGSFFRIVAIDVELEFPPSQADYVGLKLK